MLQLKISDLEGGKLRILAVPVHREGQHRGGQSEGVLQLHVDQDQNHYDSVVNVCVKIEVIMLLPLHIAEDGNKVICENSSYSRG